MLWFYAGVMVLLGGAWLAHCWWAARVDVEIADGAQLEWERLTTHEPELMQGLSREKFGDIYRRVHFPRFPGYALACVATFFATLPVTFALLLGGLWAMERLGFMPQPSEFAGRYFMDGETVRIFTAAPPEAAVYYAQDLGGFYYFFGVAIAWMATVTFFMRRYHRRRPGYIRDEIIRAR